MAEELRHRFFKENTQTIVVDPEAAVLDSDNHIFSLTKSESLLAIHPFFYTLPPLFSEENKQHYFHCIRMEFLGKQYFFDIETRLDNTRNVLNVFVIDLTAHYRNMHTIKQTRNESVIDFNIIQELNNELQIQRGFKNKFVAQVSHEIRTPLNSIVGFIKVLQNTGLNREQLDIANIIQNASNNLVSIVDDLLDISKIEAGKLELKNRRYDFHEVIDDIVRIYTLRAQERGLSFQYDLDPLVPRFLILDKLRLNQILINLLENALKYTKEGSIQLVIKTTSKNKRKIPLEIEIRDTGIGMNPQRLETIFDSYTQLEDSEKYQGTGLGLHIVKELVNLMNADISVSSVPEQGSSFIITLNAGVSHDQKSTKTKNKKPVKSGTPRNKYRILLGEDIENSQLLMMKLFAGKPEYNLDIAKNGEQLLLFLERFSYDLILMDITMPVMDGIDTTARIRGHENPKLRKLPIIGLSARTTEEDRLECEEVGMNAFLTKPVDDKLLFETIDKLLHRYKRKEPRVS